MHVSSSAVFLLFLCLSALLCLNSVIAATDKAESDTASSLKNKRKQWSDAKLNELEKQWELDDDPEELEMEYEKNQKIAAMKNKINFDDPKEVKKALKNNRFGLAAGGGSKMLFITLKSPQIDGKKWDKTSVDKIAKRWTDLLRTANLDGDFYNIDESGKLLVHVNKGWMLQDIVKFILKNPETEFLEIDSKKYTLDDLDLDDEDDDYDFEEKPKKAKKSAATPKKDNKATSSKKKSSKKSSKKPEL